MKFRSKFDEHQRFYTEAGTDIVPVFCLNSDGTEVIECGKRSIRDEINSYKDSTDINIITKQLMCGNETITQAFKSGAFSAPKEVYADTTMFPKYMGEYQKIMRNAYAQYNAIPEEIRKQFDTIDDFINASDDTIKTVFDNYNSALSKQVISRIENEKEGE